MIGSAPIGLPGLIVMMVGLAVFAAALVSARRRRGIETRGTGARSRRSLIGILVQGFAIFVVGAGPVLLVLPGDAPRAVIDAAVVALLMALAIGLFVWASRAMGRNWSLVARTRTDHQLVETGPFAWIRHPIYTALSAFVLALAVAYGHLSHLWMAAPLYAVGTWLRVAEEERLLRAMFGPAYDTYAARVKRFVPGVF